VNITDAIDAARRAFEIAGRGCLVRTGEDEPRYATVAEIAARLEPHSDATMLLTAVSEAVERYDPSAEAVILLETDSGFQVLILSPYGWDYVGGFELGPAVWSRRAFQMRLILTPGGSKDPLRMSE
jgi:hypothetical protein